MPEKTGANAHLREIPLLISLLALGIQALKFILSGGFMKRFVSSILALFLSAVLLHGFTSKNVYLTTNTLSSGTSVRPGFSFLYVWNAIGQSKAGKLYMCIGNHDETQGGGDVCVVEFNPYTSTMRSLGTLTECYTAAGNFLAGEYANKVHTWLNGTPDGKVWLGGQAGGRGSHLMYIDPADGVLKDYSRTQKYIYQSSTTIPQLNHPELPPNDSNGVALSGCDFVTMSINPYASRYMWTEEYTNLNYYCWDLQADTVHGMGGGDPNLRCIVADKAGNMWTSVGGFASKKSFNGQSKLVGRGLNSTSAGGSAVAYTHSYDSAFTVARQSGLVELYDFVNDTAIPFADLPDGGNANSSFRAMTISKDDKTLYILGGSGIIYALNIATRAYQNIGSISGNLAGSYAFGNSSTMDSLGNWYICTWGGNQTYWVQVHFGKDTLSPLSLEPTALEKTPVRMTRLTPLEIYPNPVRAMAGIGLSAAVFGNKEVNVTIVDQRGRLIERRSLRIEANRDSRLTWDAGRYSSGLYIVRVEAAGKSFSKSVIVMR